MKQPKTVGIRELKNNLSAYIREVRGGARVFVSDRGTVVAELREPGAVYGAERPERPSWQKLVEEGVLRLPTHPRRPLPPSPLPYREGTAKKLLDWTRGDR